MDDKEQQAIRDLLSEGLQIAICYDAMREIAKEQGLSETEANLLCDNNYDGKYRIINKYVPMPPKDNELPMKKRF